MEPFIGQIMLFGGNFAPRGWAFCNGQLMSIAQNSALFSLLGTMYGGDGRTTFGLPDLRGRVPVGAGAGAGPGLKPVEIGQTLGFDSVTLNQTNLPAHTHAAVLTKLNLPVNNIEGENDTSSPIDGILANSGSSLYASSVAGEHVYNSANLGTVTVGATGNNVPFDVHQPSLGMNYCIALEGIYPSRG